MKNLWSVLLGVAVILSILIMLAVSWHSTEEIHYLKTFYPTAFTVEEAYYATWVEFLKVHIINLPLVVIIIVALYVWRRIGEGE